MFLAKEIGHAFIFYSTWKNCSGFLTLITVMTFKSRSKSTQTLIISVCKPSLACCIILARIFGASILEKKENRCLLIFVFIFCELAGILMSCACIRICKFWMLCKFVKSTCFHHIPCVYFCYSSRGCVPRKLVGYSRKCSRWTQVMLFSFHVQSEWKICVNLQNLSK